MKTNILIALFCLCSLSLLAQLSGYTMLQLNGFSTDVLVDETENPTASGILDGDGWAFYTLARKAQGGLPSSFSSNGGVPYTIAAAAGNNALCMRKDGTRTGRLTLATPMQTGQLWILGTSGNGTSQLNLTIHYTDSSTDVANISYPDWYTTNAASAAYHGLARIKAANGNYDERYNFALYERVVAVNPQKTVAAISFNLTSETYGSVLAISASNNTTSSAIGTLYIVPDAHLDTQWNWTVQSTIDEYILNTLNDNFALFDNYPHYHFNFEGAVKYEWMKEYYPEKYTQLKQYVAAGRWSVQGASYDANDVMVPSAESIIRNFMLGQNFYSSEFGSQGGYDIMLPDCFGFSYALPSLAAHCGIKGFHTQKLSWGSAYNYDALPNFARWRGVDGSEIVAMLKMGAYTEQDAFKKNMANDADMATTILANKRDFGFAGQVRYAGTGDRGGALSSETAQWLETSATTNGLIQVKMVSPDEVIDSLARCTLPVIDHELPMKTHGTGCYTSQTILKWFNRHNELAADAAERAASIACWLGGMDYPQQTLNTAWKRIIWHQFHDDLTGTSLPAAYSFSVNDHALSQLDFSNTTLNAAGAAIRQMDTHDAQGVPVVVYNPLSIARTDVVEISIETANAPTQTNVLNNAGESVPTQVLEYANGKAKILFLATVPAVGYATFDIHLNEACTATAGILTATTSTLENANYKLTLDANGDVASIVDKQRGNAELLAAPIRMAMLFDESLTWPSWEVHYDQLSNEPRGYVDENVQVSIAENGPLRASLKISRTKEGSAFVQYISLMAAGSTARIDFRNEINWQSSQRLLKVVFPLAATNDTASYDLSLGAVKRGNSKADLYEVCGHQWADLTDQSGTYGISILNNSKYGWDKPNSNTLRLSLIHTPKVSNNYSYEQYQDLGLNKFTYALFCHTGSWNETTQWEAARLNQPMMAFATDIHNGSMGKLFGFVACNNDKVAVKALKKAEHSNELIVRCYELTGQAQTATLTFPAQIIAAREVNGVEQPIGTATFSGTQLSFTIGRFAPKTFALTLAAPATELQQNTPTSVAVALPYNTDVMSYNSNRADGHIGTTGYNYPAELLSDTLEHNNIRFAIGKRADGQPNAVRCEGQSITLPPCANARKLYLLATTANRGIRTANFDVDGKGHTIDVQSCTDHIGQWGTYFAASNYNPANVAFTATHRHVVASQKDMSYSYLYMFSYAISIPANAQTLTLPTDTCVYVLAATLSDNSNDDPIAISSQSEWPTAKDVQIDEENIETCGQLLQPVTISASGYVKDSEGPAFAADGNPYTKWCDDKSASRWIAYDFGHTVNICQWTVLHAGIEGTSKIASEFKLQYIDENGIWQNAEWITNNTDNKTNRTLSTPISTHQVRLELIKGENNGPIARVYGFDVYGTSTDTGTHTPKAASTCSNYPNPFSKSTAIACEVPANTTDIKLAVYDITGKLVDTRCYAVNAAGKQVLQWQAENCAAGLYHYALTTCQNNCQTGIQIGKMVCMGK